MARHAARHADDRTQTYVRENIRRGHEFVDTLSSRDDALVLDMTLLHETRPLGDARDTPSVGDAGD